MYRRIISAAAGGLLALGALAACAAPSESPAAPSSTSAAPDASGDPADTPDPTDPAAELSCETMISAGTVEALTAAGWTAQPKEFVIGDLALTSGMVCFWADYSVGSDHGQLYGWSPISADQAAQAQESLIADGWRREDGPQGVYFTENPEYSMGTDEDGYGMTYLFGDGWVTLSDTKQGLLLVTWTG